MYTPFFSFSYLVEIPPPLDEAFSVSENFEVGNFNVAKRSSSYYPAQLIFKINLTHVEFRLYTANHKLQLSKHAIWWLVPC